MPTQEEINQYKTEVKVVMEDHLKTKGWPDMEPNAIMAELLTLWKLLDEKGLIKYGATYQGFVHGANQAYMHRRIVDAFGGVSG